MSVHNVSGEREPEVFPPPPPPPPEVKNLDSDKWDGYFLRCLKYELCVYILAVVGAVSQIVAAAVIIAYLGIGLDRFVSKELNVKATVYSIIGIVTLTATSITELLLIHAVKTRVLRYIQWWMVSTLIIFIFTCLVTVIAGFTMYEQGLWVTLAFLYLLIRLPFQVHFVDKFAHFEIIHKEPNTHDTYKAVYYNRLV